MCASYLYRMVGPTVGVQDIHSSKMNLYAKHLVASQAELLF